MNKDKNEQINFIKTCTKKIDSSLLPIDFDQWTIEQQFDHLTDNVGKYFPGIPESLRYVLPASFKDADCSRSVSEKPNWLDMDKFRRGQAFAQRYISLLYSAQLMSLFAIFSFTDDLKPLILSQKSNTPYRAFKRYLSTILRVNHWYHQDPWDEGTQAHRDIKVVRKMHLTMRQRLCGYDDKQMNAMSQIPNAYCPMLKTLVEDFRDSCPASNDFHYLHTETRVKGINQGHMSETQFGFMGLIVLYPEKFGIHYASDADLDAFCHTWRALGYLLGIEDRYNFCRGSLDDVRRRCSEWLEYLVKPNLRKVTAEWEHMSMCVYEGIKYFIFMPFFKAYMLSFCDILNLEMPHLRKSLSLLENATYVLSKFMIANLMKIQFFVVVLNIYVRRCLYSAENFGPEKHDELRQKSRKITGF